MDHTTMKVEDEQFECSHLSPKVTNTSPRKLELYAYFKLLSMSSMDSENDL